MIRICIIIFALHGLTCAQGTGQIEPDPSVQAALGRLTNAKVSAVSFYEAVLELKTLRFKLGERQVFEQALYHDAVVDRRAEPKAIELLVWQLFKCNDRMARIIAMRHWDSPDADIRNLARKVVLKQHRDTLYRSDFLVGSLWSARKDPPMELVEHVTGGDPGAIIQKFAGRSDEDEPPVDPAQARADWLGERIIDDAHWRLERTYDCPVHVAAAVRELDRFSRSPHWWARLYTAEMLRRHESFRRKDIVERLRKDENKMVAEWVDRPYYHGMMPEEFQEWKKSMPGMPDRPK